MRSLIFILIVLTSCSLSNNAKGKEDSYTVYLVRHAEKMVDKENPRDPGLTKCGKKRAAAYITYFNQQDLNVFYSSDYKRTRETARPLAESRYSNISLYNPRALPELAAKIKSEKKNVIVVGHSNTTPTLAGLLSNQTFEQIDEKIYDDIFKITFTNGVVKVEQLKSSFKCEE